MTQYLAGVNNLHRADEAKRNGISLLQETNPLYAKGAGYPPHPEEPAPFVSTRSRKCVNFDVTCSLSQRFSPTAPGSFHSYTRRFSDRRASHTFSQILRIGTVGSIPSERCGAPETPFFVCHLAAIPGLRPAFTAFSCCWAAGGLARHLREVSPLHACSSLDDWHIRCSLVSIFTLILTNRLVPNPNHVFLLSHAGGCDSFQIVKI